MFLVTDSLINTTSRHCCVISNPVLSYLRPYQMSKYEGRFLEQCMTIVADNMIPPLQSIKVCAVSAIVLDVTLTRFSKVITCCENLCPGL